MEELPPHPIASISAERLDKQLYHTETTAVALLAFSIPALADECSDYEEQIAAFHLLVSNFDKARQFDAPAYEAAAATLNVSQRAAIKETRDPTAPADFGVANAARASLNASLVAAKNAHASAEASVHVIGTVLKAIPTATIGNPSALSGIGEVSDAASAASSLAVDTGQSAAIASGFAFMVFHNAIHAAICR